MKSDSNRKQSQRGDGPRKSGKRGHSTRDDGPHRNLRSPKDRKIGIVYEDNDIIVVSKPSGMLSVPIPDMQSMNLQEILNEELETDNQKAITVHRIDRYTSGLVVFAKHSEAHKVMVRQFLAHEPIRTYLSLVRGIIPVDEGELIHYLKKVSQGFRNVIVPETDPEGTMARLTFKVLERYATTTLVQINLDTGLKNQIRVQFAAFGHPLVGDRHYVPDEVNEPLIDRQALHAWKLEFLHPRTGRRMFFEATQPTDLRRLIEHYRKVDK